MQDEDYKLEFGLPLGCAKDNCDYYVAMGPNAEDSEFLDVYLQGTAEGWVAVGFSHNQQMVCVCRLISINRQFFARKVNLALFY